MTAFIAAFMLVLIAEMGDKTQLLAMAFAARYRPGQVLAGVFIATLLLNALAVGAGTLLNTVIPVGVLSFIAALSFIFFGLWALKGEDEHEEAEKERATGLGPVLTVATSFFIAEMGVKTQLAAVSLTVQYGQPFLVLAGATLGMTIADSLGVIAGSLLGNRISPSVLRWTSSVLFILFGLTGIYQAAATRFGAMNAAGIAAVAALLVIAIAVPLSGVRRRVEDNSRQKPSNSDI
jgi:putative Ca2+/H+ antiporter (TMEM165/GDT1 family)